MRHSLKLFVIFLAISLSGACVVHANPVDWMSCTTPGDALGTVELALNTMGAPDYAVNISVGSLSDQSPAQFTMKTTKKEYDAQAKARAYQIIGRSTDSNDFGGGTSNAILLNLNSKNKAKITGVLAMSGTVYELICRAP